MNCPYCNAELEHGACEVTALRSKPVVRFYLQQEMEKAGLFTIRSGYAAENASDEHPALRCARCKKFFVEFDEGIPYE